MSSLLKIFFIAFISLFSLVVFAPVAAAQGGFKLKPPSPDISTSGIGGGDLVSTLLTIINYGLSLVGAVALAALIWGGFTYITSAGNDKKIEKAKAIITYAIIGLFVVILSWVIVNAIINEIF